ncbi:tRNA glutamyl-Q(34) synthetase GluQRS [Luteimonas deserti]|uniref:Glutamyl-Q tRNA(Asp) synthetase n=1 Tax=Luteimonas deserti TaxID=2752306 RepID=A0A7Z0QVN5_9GAMM|nr:tRNA glutamyl-Q(34) synthetase GluQRS [Luteimonas deserti]NYZ64218.1 tRNA glutamyl-Q(34) synthetase GluQRS [Luteimonas deserti]
MLTGAASSDPQQTHDTLPCGRFAPSPTGPLHAGSLMAALGSWLMARRDGGLWRVRIEDVDRVREAPGAAAAQLAMLEACGLQWDGALVRQSSRDALYRAALERLLAAGHAFVCHCSRADLAASGGRHRGRCVAGRVRPDPAVRFRVPDGCHVAFDDRVRGRVEQAVDREVGDFVLRRADGLWAYQLAVVVDDADQGVTDVVRGADLLDSTPRQILLQRSLGLPTPRYAHLPLLLDEAGRKLSKSHAALPVDPARPLAALAAAWAQLGQVTLPPISEVHAFLEAACAAFEPARIPARDHRLCVAP